MMDDTNSEHDDNADFALTALLQRGLATSDADRARLTADFARLITGALPEPEPVSDAVLWNAVRSAVRRSRSTVQEVVTRARSCAHDAAALAAAVAMPNWEPNGYG